jgi:hypothetical protein
LLEIITGGIPQLFATVNGTLSWKNEPFGDPFNFFEINNITGVLVPTSGPGGIHNGTLDITGVFFTDNPFYSATSSGAFNATIPEPSTLLTFGTGVLGLVGLIRRKLKLGT